MRANIAYYLFILYLAAMFKPVLPLIQDGLAHSLWKMEHIATVHHHQGENHLDDELQKEGNKNESSSTGGVKSFETVSAHILTANTEPYLFIRIFKNHYPSKLLFLKDPTSELNTPPPKV